MTTRCACAASFACAMPASPRPRVERNTIFCTRAKLRLIGVQRFLFSCPGFIPPFFVLLLPGLCFFVSCQSVACPADFAVGPPMACCFTSPVACPIGPSVIADRDAYLGPAIFCISDFSLFFCLGALGPQLLIRHVPRADCSFLSTYSAGCCFGLTNKYFAGITQGAHGPCWTVACPTDHYDVGCQALRDAISLRCLLRTLQIFDGDRLTSSLYIVARTSPSGVLSAPFCLRGLNPTVDPLSSNLPRFRSV